jgi:hypothetical protein
MVRSRDKTSDPRPTPGPDLWWSGRWGLPSRGRTRGPPTTASICSRLYVDYRAGSRPPEPDSGGIGKRGRNCVVLSNER